MKKISLVLMVLVCVGGAQAANIAFSTPDLVVSHSELIRDTSVVVDSSSSAAYVFYDVGGSFYWYSCRFSKNTGSGWSEANVNTHLAAASTCDAEITSNGTLYVSYKTDSSSGTYISKSTDGGANWSHTNFAGRRYYHNLAVSPNGNNVLQVGTDNSYDLSVHQSYDGGANYTTTDTKADDYYAKGKGAAWDGNTSRRWMAYENTAGNGLAVKYSDDGATWTGAAISPTVSSGNSSGHYVVPDNGEPLAIDADGKVYLVYTDPSSGGSNVYLRTVSVNGEGNVVFGSAIQVNDTADSVEPGSAHVAVGDGWIGVAWMEGNDIKFDAANLSSLTFDTDVSVTSSGGVWTYGGGRSLDLFASGNKAYIAYIENPSDYKVYITSAVVPEPMTIGLMLLGLVGLLRKK